VRRQFAFRLISRILNAEVNAIEICAYRIALKLRFFETVGDASSGRYKKGASGDADASGSSKSNFRIAILGGTTLRAMS